MFLFLGLYPSAPGPLHAGAPLKINFQGRLEESGQPAEGTKTFIFKVYTALSGGSLVWTSQAQNVELTNGVFSVVLATGSPVNLSTAAFSGARYVEIVVNGYPLSPRQEMVSAPYALVAQALSSDARISLANLEKDPSSSSIINTATNALDWSQLKNVPAGFADGIDDIVAAVLSTAAITSGKFGDERVAISTGAFYGGFNAAGQLVRLDASGRLPAGTSVAGAIALPVKRITAADFPYTVTGNDSTVLIDASAAGAGANVVINLPDAAGIAGRIYTFKRLDDLAGLQVINLIPAVGGNSIDGSFLFDLYLKSMQGEAITLQSDGTNWMILSWYWNKP